MHGNRVDHINIYRNAIRHSCIISLPISVVELLNYPKRVIVREHPLSISIVGIDDTNSVKMSLNKDCNGHISFNPIGDIDEYIGRYSYEIDDMTLYLEKIL